jgi:secreted Zn-dependent insulinase-like peptidase
MATNTKRHRVTSEIRPIKGQCDKRDYQFHTLSNGIEAVLVRIPAHQSSKSAVSVSVGCGSMDEPDEFGGLAHFVEHCVFLGNKKYPSRNSLDKLLSKHNGYSNAYTELEQTTYFLEVNTEAISKAIDIFAAAFDSPLFDTELCCGELEAVDSEFHETLNSDSSRIEQMLCQLSHPNHPYRKFTWGNRASLLEPHGKEGLMTAAKKFYETFYLPSRMKICIVSSKSFDKMKGHVDGFAGIGLENLNPQCPPNPLIKCSLAFSPPMALAMKPIKKIHRLVLNFPLPPTIHLYRNKPMEYLAEVLGHEGEGSLIEMLRKSNFASSLSAGVGSGGYSRNSGMSVFEIDIVLTTEGLAEYIRVINEYVFAYIQKIRECGISERVYSEMSQVAHFQFEHVNEFASKDPIDVAEELSATLLPHMGIDRTDLLKYEYIYDDFRPELVVKFLDLLTPDNCILMLVSPDVGPFDNTESIFGIEYRRMDPGDVFTASVGVAPVPFVMPPAINVFLPAKGATEIKALPAGEKTSFSTPSLIKQTPNSKITVFQTIRSTPSPKVEIRLRFDLTNLTFVEPVKTFVYLQLISAYVSDIVKPTLYPSHIVGYGTSVSVASPSESQPAFALNVSVEGYHEKIVSVVEILLQRLRLGGELELESERLARVRETLLLKYLNGETHPVTNQALNIRRKILADKSFYRAADMANALKGLDEFSGDVSIQTTHVMGLVVGSASEELVENLQAVIDSSVVFSANPKPTDPSIPLTVSSEISVSESTINPEEPTSVALVYYQISPVFSITATALADIISDFMSQPFFDSLRTEEQLGYSVECGSRCTNGSVGIEFMIQSSGELTAAELVTRIERFIAKFYPKEIAQLSASEYNEQIDALVETMLEPPTSLGDETKHLWTELVSGRCMWDINDRVTSEMKNKFANNKALVNSTIEQFLKRKDNRIVVTVDSQVSKKV